MILGKRAKVGESESENDSNSNWWANGSIVILL